MNEKENRSSLKENLANVIAELLSTSGTKRCKTLSVATGVFIGLSPIW